MVERPEVAKIMKEVERLKIMTELGLSPKLNYSDEELMPLWKKKDFLDGGKEFIQLLFENSHYQCYKHEDAF
jgi:hypothetical protein